MNPANNTSTKENAERIPRTDLCLWLLIAGLVVVLEFILGNTADVEHYGRSSLTWMVDRWRQQGDLLSYAWIIPVISAFLLWRNRTRLREAEKHPAVAGIVVVVISLVVHIVSYRAMLPRLALAALIGLLWGIPFAAFGATIARILLFPCAYLLFCIPLGFVDTWSFPLRMASTKASAAILNGLGIACARVGTAIYSEPRGNFEFDVGDPCSGLRYMLTILALSALFAYLVGGPKWKRWLLFLFSPLLAIAGNILRIVLIGIASTTVSARFALGLYHNTSGYIVFFSVVMMLVAMNAIMNFNIIHHLKAWKSPEQKHY